MLNQRSRKRSSAADYRSWLQYLGKNIAQTSKY